MSITVKEFIDHHITISTEKPLTIFAGAGVSFDSGIPTVNLIKQEILANLPLTQEHRQELLELNFPFELFMAIIKARIPLEDLYPIFKSEILGLAHQLVANLYARDFLKDIYTTNFDTLFESALEKKNARFSVIKNYNSFKEISKHVEHPRVVKLHGSIEDYESLGITIQKVAEQRYLHKLDPLIKNFSIAKNPTLFIGYSMSDVFDIVPLFRRYAKQMQQELFFISHSTEENTRFSKFSSMGAKIIFQPCLNAYYIRCNTNIFLEKLAEKYGDQITQPNTYRDKDIAEAIKEYINKHLPDPFDKIKLAASFALQLTKPERSLQYHELADQKGTSSKIKALATKASIIEIHLSDWEKDRLVNEINEILTNPAINPPLYIRCLLLLSRVYARTDPKKTILLARKAYKLSVKYKVSEGKLSSLKCLSYGFGIIGFQQKSKPHFSLALKYILTARRTQIAQTEKRVQLRLLILSGTILKQLNKNALASQEFEKAYIIASHLKLLKDMLTIRSNQINLMSRSQKYFPLRMQRLVECKLLSEKLQMENKTIYYTKKIEQLKNIMSNAAEKTKPIS